MNEFYKDCLILDMKPNSIVHRYAVNGKISGNLGAITCLDNALIILVSPIGCGFHYRYTVRARNKLNDVDCVNLKNQEVVFGSHDKLVALIKKLDAEYAPKAIFVVPSVVTDVINDDLTGISNSVQTEVKAKIVVIVSQAFSHMDKSNFTKNLKNTAMQKNSTKQVSNVLYKGCGYVEVMDALVEQVMEPQKIEPNSVNIESFLWGYGGATKLERMQNLLLRMGIKVNTFLPLGDIDSIKIAPKAKLNIVRRKKWAVSMKTRFGTDFFHLAMPFEWHGFDDICEFYREIGKHLDLETSVEKILQEEIEKYKSRYEELKTQNSKRRACIISGGVSNIAETLKAYHKNFGVRVASICVIMNTRFAEENGLDDSIMKRFFAKAEEAKLSMNCDAELYINPSKEKLEVLMQDCDYLICGRNPRYAKLNKPILPMYIDRAAFDFESFMEIMEEVSAKIAEPLQLSNKLLLNCMEFDDIFFPREEKDCNSKASRDIYTEMWRLRKK
ncbi:MAG: hypothetical protein MJ050_07225 [Phascolarctobacterium sp.]|nr:hypothetical protein [Phascolarctobacterium sp.]